MKAVLSHNHLVIMAGGVGSRFWPMSTVETPKQFIDVLGVGRTLIQQTGDRFKGICPPENIWLWFMSSFLTSLLKTYCSNPAAAIRLRV